MRLKIKGMALISTLPGILRATGAVYQVSSAGAYPEQGMGWHQDAGAPTNTNVIGIVYCQSYNVQHLCMRVLREP